jgi:hypothetical protein
MHPLFLAVEEFFRDDYLGASEEERRKLDALLSLRLTDAAQRNRPLHDVIQEISHEAQAKGMTPDILQEILDGR